MYLHLGQNEIVPERRLIGIFDLDKCSTSKRTRESTCPLQIRKAWYWIYQEIFQRPLWSVTTPIIGKLYI